MEVQLSTSRKRYYSHSNQSFSELISLLAIWFLIVSVSFFSSNPGAADHLNPACVSTQGAEFFFPLLSSTTNTTDSWENFSTIMLESHHPSFQGYEENLFKK